MSSLPQQSGCYSSPRYRRLLVAVVPLLLIGGIILHLSTTRDPRLRSYKHLDTYTKPFEKLYNSTFSLPSPLIENTYTPLPSTAEKRPFLILQHVSFNAYTNKSNYGEHDATPLIQQSIATHKRYAHAHGYEHEVDSTAYLPEEWSARKKSLNKVHMLLRVVLRELAKAGSERLEWVMMTDSDTIIYDPSIPLHLLLPSTHQSFDLDPLPLILGNQDFNGFNAGAMFFRVHHHVASYLAQVLAKAHEGPLQTEAASTPLDVTDQQAFGLVLREQEISEHFYELPQYWFNAYPLDPDTNLGRPSAELEPMLQIHFVALSKFSTNIDPFIAHGEEVYRQALEVAATRGEEGNGLEYMPGVGRSRKRARAWWRRGGRKNGVESIRFNPY